MTRSKTEITNNSTEETGNRASQTRIPRSEEKREIVEIPDGNGGFIKMIKSPTPATLSKSGLKLQLPEKKGMYRQWVSDQVDGNLQHYVDLGFTPVTDNGICKDPVRGGNRENGTVYLMYPMEIQEDLLQKLREKAKVADPVLQAREKQNELLEGYNNPELGTYAASKEGFLQTKVL